MEGGQRLRPGRLSLRAIQYILAAYPIMVDGELVTVRPHDLRRTSPAPALARQRGARDARRLYEAGITCTAVRRRLEATRLRIARRER